jgi:DNA-binding PadR family transcriptional regulator
MFDFRRGGQGPWGRGPWGHGFGARRAARARRGDVRAAVLALLAERPMHGYEMIQELESRTGGIWRPSAGSIYPTLQLLQDEGLVDSSEVGGKRMFSLTESGKRVAVAGQHSPWEQVAEGADAGAIGLRDAAFQVVSAAMQVGAAGSEDQVTRAVDVLADARRRIYAILGEGE